MNKKQYKITLANFKHAAAQACQDQANKLMLQSISLHREAIRLMKEARDERDDEQAGEAR